jgi:Domain of Unknown Function (DUF928)
MLSQRYFSCLMALGLLLVGTRVAIAGTPFSANTIARAKVSATKVIFKPSSKDRRPLRTVGAGSRGNQCPQDLAAEPVSSGMSNALPLMALVPSNNDGLTVAERPTFWMYLPQTSAKQVVLSLQTENASSQSHWFLPMPSTPGVVSLQLPADAPPLKIGQTYQWAAVLVCGDRPGPNDPAIAAWVTRVAPSQSIPPGGTALDRASLHGEQGIWYDMLTALGQELRSKSTQSDLTDVWANVLKSEGLEPVALEPIQQK